MMTLDATASDRAAQMERHFFRRFDRLMQKRVGILSEWRRNRAAEKAHYLAKRWDRRYRALLARMGNA